MITIWIKLVEYVRMILRLSVKITPDCRRDCNGGDKNITE
jgi:hypothetical protein